MITNLIDMIKLTKLKGTLDVGVFNNKLLVSTNANDILHIIDIDSDKQFGGSYNTTDGFNLDNRVAYKMSNVYNRYIGYENSNPIYTIENIQDDDRYNGFLNLKASSAPIHYIVDGIYIPVFYGILPLNKGDSASLNIMEKNVYNSVIRYDVYKIKANKTLHIYLNLLNII